MTEAGRRRPRRPARTGTLVAGRTLEGTGSGVRFGPETFVERVGDDAVAGGFAYVDPDEPAVHGRIVAMRADGPGSATLVRLMAVENGRSVLRAANPVGPDIAVTRANETMIRGVVVFVGQAV